MRLAKDDWFIAVYLSAMLVMVGLFLACESGFDPFGWRADSSISVSADCLKRISDSDEKIVPLARSEPEFQQIFRKA